ncbi:MAG TPA: Rpn family recombination-promoting nuclease/putative transposase [Kofleriaceae bacterium]|jgi:predicted transposase/invertase (TIGR01784 family)|nr:Rpn family recombination-promoting nuclease/putative transposase [Kofleriaceae bacterium]
MTRPVFADPKTDFVFQRIFGSEDHKPVLLGFLNDLLELDDAHRIQSVSLLPPEQRPKVPELKYSIVDVKCVDVRGTTYVVEMQVLNVEAFEKRVMYNVAKAYTNELDTGQVYPDLNDVIGISICDFELWPRNKGFEVPMLSRWRMQEQKSGTRGLSQLQLVFLELPKYDGARQPESLVDTWAYFFREAENLTTIPDALAHPPLREALEAARTARFTTAEWDAYIAAGMAIQNERGALSLAHREGYEEGEERGLERGREEGREEGREQGREQGLRMGIEALCDAFGIDLSAERKRALQALDAMGLQALMTKLRAARRWP